MVDSALHLNSTPIAVALWLAGAALAAWLAFSTSSLMLAGRGEFKKETGAYLDPSFASVFDAMTRRRYRLAAVFILAMSTTLVLVLRVSRLDPVLFMAPLLAAMLALESVDRLRSAGRDVVVPDSHSAVARVRRVVLSDYLSWGAQLLTWAAVTVVVTVAGRVFWQRHEVAGPVVVAVSAGATTILGVAVFAVWFGRALCERPIPAVDGCHLYLQDALRAFALERVHSVLRLSAVLFALGVTNSSDGSLGFSFGIGLLACGMAILLASLALPSRQFRRRLWGTLLPGEVLLPGQPVPFRVGAGA